MILKTTLSSGTIGGKTGKTSVLPGFSKIERGGGSGGAPHCYGGLTQRRARRLWFLLTFDKYNNPIPIKGTDYANRIVVSPLDLKTFHWDCESRLHCTREASYLDRTHPGGVELKCAVNDQTRKKKLCERAKPRILLYFRIPFAFDDAKKIFFKFELAYSSFSKSTIKNDGMQWIAVEFSK